MGCQRSHNNLFALFYFNLAVFSLCCSTQAYMICGILVLRLGIEPTYPALEGEF